MAQYEVQRKAIEQKNSSNSSTRTVQLKHNNVASIIQMAKMNPEMLTQNDVMALQKTMGNAAVSQFIKGSGDKHNEAIQKKDGKLEDNESLMKKENNTGLPDNLKVGVENLSGIDMSDVRVHYNSDKPAGVGALAYTQGADIHVAPGQEKHLAHEAWHVVQQSQGRVQATTQMKGVDVNDDVGLEREADEMGDKVLKGKGEIPIKKNNMTLKNNESTVQRTIMNGRSALSNIDSTKKTMKSLLKERLNREPNDSEVAQLDILINKYIRNNKYIKTVPQVLSEVIANTSEHLDVMGSGRPESQLSLSSRETTHFEHLPMTTLANVQNSAENKSTEEQVDLQSKVNESAPISTTSNVQVTSIQQEETEHKSVSSSESLVHDVSDVPEMKLESATHVGFEIEVGGSYKFPLAARETLKTLVNKTLCKCVVNNRVILEMLLDDIKVNNNDNNITAQVEFRTVPLNFEEINTDLGMAIKKAISNFPKLMISNPQISSFMIEKKIEEIKGQKKSIEKKGRWEPTELLQNSNEILRNGRTSSRFQANSGDLAQHTTTSIEIDAFSRIPEQQQGLLYPSGVSTKNKQQLLDKIAYVASNFTNGEIDASTCGRNDAGIMVKTPVESLLAADPSLITPNHARNPGSAKISGAEKYNLKDIDQEVEEIRHREKFPSIQGENETGYRAIAEKLQPPLKDTQSGELRVLVEHRKGLLRNAVNAALKGDSKALDEISKAAKDMDQKRLSRRK